MNHEPIDLNRFREQKASRYTEEEQDIIARIERTDSHHPAGREAAFTEYEHRPELVAKHIQEKLEKNGYPADLITGVRRCLELLIEEHPDLTPSELSHALADAYIKQARMSYEENQQHLEATVAAHEKREHQERVKQTGKAALTLHDGDGESPSSTTRNHLRSVETPDE